MAAILANSRDLRADLIGVKTVTARSGHGFLYWNEEIASNACVTALKVVLTELDLTEAEIRVATD